MSKSIIELSGSKASSYINELDQMIDRLGDLLGLYPEQHDDDGIPKDPGGYQQLLNDSIEHANRFLTFFEEAVYAEASKIELTIDDAVQIRNILRNEYILKYAENGLKRVAQRGDK